MLTSNMLSTNMSTSNISTSNISSSNMLSSNILTSNMYYMSSTIHDTSKAREMPILDRRKKPTTKKLLKKYSNLFNKASPPKLPLLSHHSSVLISQLDSKSLLN